MTRRRHGSRTILTFMVVYVGIIACVLAIAAAVKWTAAEYLRQRKNRQMQHALRLAVGEMA